MRFKYQVVKELCSLMLDAQKKIQATKDMTKNIENLKWSNEQHNLRLKDYQYQFTDFCNVPNTILLDEVIKILNELVNSKSKLADFDELKSDTEWLKEYYTDESWNDVTRWLSNIDGTLRETFSEYMEALQEVHRNV
ncbi:hypothetical protein JHD46_00490 [Sulfurimonas sp. SAG-AH-194-C20]|nr:hypothetical protein [Sulfurimonas sp. SAG-AH-194-C20]MDF1878109.1 hypothetical protein [Sulfurimonas sp. SAG-AH-194-C20]